MGKDLRAPPLVPVSWGELLDKITILEIKEARITAPPARANVRHELALLREAAAPALGEDEITPLIGQLRRVNLILWEVEDDIRVEDARGAFGDRFVALARAVYRTNDERARLKREINARLGSVLVEEKHHPTTGS